MAPSCGTWVVAMRCNPTGRIGRPEVADDGTASSPTRNPIHPPLSYTVAPGADGRSACILRRNFARMEMGTSPHVAPSRRTTVCRRENRFRTRCPLMSKGVPKQKSHLLHETVPISPQNLTAKSRPTGRAPSRSGPCVGGHHLLRHRHHGPGWECSFWPERFGLRTWNRRRQLCVVGESPWGPGRTSPQRFGSEEPNGGRCSLRPSSRVDHAGAGAHDGRGGGELCISRRACPRPQPARP